MPLLLLKRSGREREAGSGKVREFRKGQTQYTRSVMELQVSTLPTRLSALSFWIPLIISYMGKWMWESCSSGPSALDIWKRCQREDTSVLRPPTLAHDIEDKIPKPVVQKRSPPLPLHLQGFILALLNSDPGRGAQVQRGLLVAKFCMPPFLLTTEAVTPPKARENLLLMTYSTSFALWTPQMKMAYNRKGMFLMIDFECWLDKAKCL